MINIPFNEDYSKQRERTPEADFYPCIVCGRAVKNVRYMVRVHEGFTVIVTEEESKQLDTTSAASGNMGLYPLGANCLALHPELKPYLQEQHTIKASDWKMLYKDLYRQCFGETVLDEDIVKDAYTRFNVIGNK